MPTQTTPARTASVDDTVVAAELVVAAVAAAESLGRDIADVPITAIAAQAGISRSTLLRRLGGSCGASDAAVRAAGIDTGGTPPVRVRAVHAAAVLISETGLAATTPAIAERADCSVFSLHAAFGGRDELMRAVFDQYSPIRDVETYFAQPRGDLRATVHGLYRAITEALNRAPRVAPAMFSEAFARPESPAVQTLAAHAAPRMLAVLGAWLTAEIRDGRVRDQPILLLAQQLLGPVLIHMFLRPVAQGAPPDRADP